MRIAAILTGCIFLAACTAREYRTVEVNTPNGVYTENVGITPPTPTVNSDGKPYVPPTIVKKPVTIYSPNAGPITVTVDEEKPAQ